MCGKIPAMATSELDIPVPAPGAKKRTDTLAMVKKLRDAGVPQQQAEAEAEVISDTAERVEDVVREEFVPKSAMREDFLALDARLTQMESRLDKRFSQLEVRMSQMEGGMKQMEERLDKRIAQSEARQARLGLTIMGGSIVAVAAIFTFIVKVIFADPS